MNRRKAVNDFALGILSSLGVPAGRLLEKKEYPVATFEPKNQKCVEYGGGAQALFTADIEVSVRDRDAGFSRIDPLLEEAESLFRAREGTEAGGCAVDSVTVAETRDEIKAEGGAVFCRGILVFRVCFRER